jgi:hypothetical protein
LKIGDTKDIVDGIRFSLSAIIWSKDLFIIFSGLLFLI